MIRDKFKLPPNCLQSMPDFIEYIRRDKDITAVFVFGSAAKGNLKPLSDLDLAVLLSDKLSKEDRKQKELDLTGTCNAIFQTDEIDLIILNDAPPRIAHHILKSGELLFLRNEMEYLDFSERIQRQYLDFKYYRNNFDQAFLEGIGYLGRTH